MPLVSDRDPLVRSTNPDRGNIKQKYIYIIFQRKCPKESQNSRNQGFSYYFCMIIEGSGSGSIPIISGSGRPKNMWIRWIRIRIRIRIRKFKFKFKWMFTQVFMIWIIACCLINLDNACINLFIGWNIFRYRSFNRKAREYKKEVNFFHTPFSTTGTVCTVLCVN